MTVERSNFYHQMVYMIWLGLRFEGEALSTFEELQTEYAEAFGTKPFPRELYASVTPGGTDSGGDQCGRREGCPVS